MRTALDAGRPHVNLELSYNKLAGVLEQNPKPPSPLQKQPCCSSVHLVLKGDRQRKTGEEAQGKSNTADTQPSPAAEELLSWPFEGLPLHRRQQITRLELSALDYNCEPCGRAAHLPLILSRLGPLLPSLTHLDVRDCHLSRWTGWDKKDPDQLYATLTAAFPNLTSLAISGTFVDMEQLAHHLGGRLEVLELGKPADHFTWEPAGEVLQHLPGLGRLRQLVVNAPGWDEVDGWDPREDGEDPDYSSDVDEDWDSELDDGEGEGGEWDNGGEEEEDDAVGVLQGGPGGGAGQGGMGVGQQAGGVPLFLQTGTDRFKAFLSSLPPSLEQLQLQTFAVHTRTREQGMLNGRELQIDLPGGKAHTLRVGWAATVRQLRFVVRWVRRSRLGPSTRHGMIPVLQVSVLEEKHVMWLGYVEHPYFLLRTVQRVDVGRLRLAGRAVQDALVRWVLLYRPQVVELQRVEVRLRAGGALSLRDGEDEELARTLRRQHVRQQLRDEQKQERKAAGWGAAGGGAAGFAAGVAGDAGEMGGAAELYLRTAGTEDVKVAALGPVRMALAAAAAAGAAAGARQAGDSGGWLAGGTFVSLTGLLAVPADSRNSSHRLVLLRGPFMSVLGDGKALDLWLSTQRSAMQLKDDLVWSQEHGKRIHAKAQPARYLRLPADASGCPASVVVQCESAEVAESFCAAVTAAAPSARGGLQVVRLAGETLDSAVFQPCTSPVLQALWDCAEGSALDTQERLRRLFELWCGLAEAFQYSGKDAENIVVRMIE